MSENKFDFFVRKKDRPCTDNNVSMTDSRSQLVYMHLPKHSSQEKNDDVVSLTRPTNSSVVTTRFLSLESLGKKLAPGTKKALPPSFTISKSKLTPNNIRFAPNQTIQTNTVFGEAASPNSSSSNSTKITMRTTLSNKRVIPNSSGRTFVRSNTMPIISRGISPVSGTDCTFMSHSVPSSTGTSLKLVKSGSTSKLSLGVLDSSRNATQYSQKLEVSTKSKPVILQSKVVAASISSQCNIVSPKILPISIQRSTNNQNKSVLSYRPQLHSGVSPTNRLTKRLFHKVEGSSLNPPPIILQSSGNLKHLSTGGSTAINIVTGKGNNGKNTISVIPLSKRTGGNHSNMVNFKIANGKILTDNSKTKVDGMAPGSDAHSISVSKPRSSNSVFNVEMGDPAENCSTTFFRKAPDDTCKPKDILEEAMFAMASDIIEDTSPTETEMSDEYLPQALNSSIKGRPSSPALVQSSATPENVSTETVQNNLPIQINLPMMMPTSVPYNSLVQTTNSDLPGLIIRTDSVTVRRKSTKEDEKKDPFKPDLSIIPILRNCSTEKPLKTQKSNFPEIDSFLEEDKSSMVTSVSKEDKKQDEEMPEMEVSITPSNSTSDPKLDTIEELMLEAGVEEQDFKKLLKWQDGIGTLDGSDLKFRMNEFDALELVEEGAMVETSDNVNKDLDSTIKSRDCSPTKSTAPQTPSIHIHHARKPNHHKEMKKDEESNDFVPDSEQSVKTAKDVYVICCCKNCGCYGLNSEFFKEKGNSFCTMACFEDYELKEIEWNKEKAKSEKNKSRIKRAKSGEKETNEVKVNNSVELSQNSSTLNVCKEDKVDASNGELFKVNPPWKEVKHTFSWVKYLDQCGKGKGLTRAAPLKLWQEPFPFGKNPFKVGMKVEGIDPQHQSLFCVMTVVDVIGHRIRLHLDGYSQIYDFWCNDNSPNIFQIGWCEKNCRKLETPPGTANFTWKAYLEHCKATPAPRQAFSTRNSSTVTTPSNFRIGMKLEAEDRKNGWTCVASVADILDNRILVHFDGWEKAFDTWFDINSPFIHPVGWCSDVGVFLFPPKDYSDPDNFSWHEYIQETNSVAVPTRAFKTRPPKNFKKDMKIEAVDKRNPMLVRVATIVETKNYKIKIHFDGWLEEYDYWVDDDSPDIHPPTWCSKSGHPLMPPLGLDKLEDSNGCGTLGCKGFGHIKGLIYSTHHTSFGCPYSNQNLDKDWETLLPDRLELSPLQKKFKLAKSIINLDTSKPIPVDLEDEESQKKRVRKRRKFFDELSPPECSKIKMPRLSSDEIKTFPGTNIKTNSQTCVYNTRNSVPPCDSNSVKTPTPSLQDEGRIDSIVHRSIFNPFYHPKPPVPKTLTLATHKQIACGKKFQKLESEKWTSKEVRQFISAITGCSLVAKKFTDHKIDGKSLLMMTQQDLIDILEIKLGPAIKIMASIISVRNTT